MNGEKKSNERGRESQRLDKKSARQRERGEIKGYRNGRMGHYGGRNVFDE